MIKPDRRFMRLPEVLHKVGLCRTSIYQKMKTGEFPRSYPLGDHVRGDRAVAWASDQIDGWIESRIRAAEDANE
ncbi:MAG: helix-turn-helix transcriptional regulator [Gammaproteobacteria bacterium]